MKELPIPTRSDGGGYCLYLSCGIKHSHLIEPRSVSESYIKVIPVLYRSGRFSPFSCG